MVTVALSSSFPASGPLALFGRLARGAQIAAAAALATVTLGLAAATAPSAIGFEPLVVLGGSMEPNIHLGDLAVVAPTPADKLEVGDVITYRLAERPDALVTHRVVAIGLDENGKFAFQTKGDANEVVDRVSVDQGAVLGRVRYHLPLLGYVVQVAKGTFGKLALIVLPGLLLVADYLRAGRTVNPASTALRETLARLEAVAA